MKKAVTRLHCSCGWQEWYEFNPELTNEELVNLTEPIIRRHGESHGKGDIELISHEHHKLWLDQNRPSNH